MAARDYGQYSGITRAMELVGERWALLIVRDLLVGPRRYGELAAGLPRIPSNILAARLKELQAAGIIRRAPRSRVIVYELTPYGRELEPVVLALGAWGFKAMGDARAEQIITPESMTMDLRTAFRPEVAAALPATAYAGRFGGAELLIRVDGPALDVSRGDGPADLAFATGPDIRRLISGDLAPERAIETGVVEVLRGRGNLLDRFASTFHLAAWSASYRLRVPELQLLRDDHGQAVLSFEVANRSYFAASISDRGDAYFREFTTRHRSLLEDQASGGGAYYVLVGDDGSVLGRFNLVFVGGSTAELGYRVAEEMVGRGVATAAVRELCALAASQHGVRRLRAATADANTASQRVLVKAGFVRVGPADPDAIGGKTGAWYELGLDRGGET